MREDQLQGLFVPVVAPFDSNEELDFVAFRHYIHSLLQEDIKGIVINGTTGESPTVAWEEVRQLFEIAKEVRGDNKKLIIVGTGTNDTRETVRRTKEAKSLGADAALVVVPYYSRPSQEGILEHFRFAASTGLPIVAYEVPPRTGVRLEPWTAYSILQLDGVIGMKDSSGSVELLRELKRLGNIKPVLCGEDALLLPMLREGGAGGMLASANAHTARFAELLRLVKADRDEEASARFEELLPFIRLLFRESNPSPIKWLLASNGSIASDRTRLPLTGISEELKRDLEGWI
ncbi:4-hydroxy-tetrahydrodipicolinate synthase [Cohnella sp. AR92]|uniref:4-hydroxy-tetrahydrodipicolinate synthase n=1 Tax=Cohnella sp. AR92 TaxID=648716 RepID=UPI000F8D8162|nr:4-hydroxy-tetrahydrodipicolinate synthase [Cohnella sp. AR92]RUS47148.1 4-hydroxy-tetrahydrodipicolinate synthase [Cohnella sp. AR92]